LKRRENFNKICDHFRYFLHDHNKNNNKQNFNLQKQKIIIIIIEMTATSLQIPDSAGLSTISSTVGTPSGAGSVLHMPQDGQSFYLPNRIYPPSNINILLFLLLYLLLFFDYII